MKYIYFLLLATFTIACAKGSQVQFDQGDRPVCYHGSAETALSEVSTMKFDPALSNLRIVPGHIDGASLIYGEQVDERGTPYQKFVLPPCK